MRNPDRPDSVRRAMDGDAEAAGELWHSHRSWVAAVLAAHMPGRADIDDLLQDVATRMVAHFSDLREPSAFKPWLRSIAVNVARSAGRKVSVRKGTHSLEVLSEDPVDPRGVRDEEARDVRGRLDRVMSILRGMHEDYREPLMLRAVEGMSQQAIAEVLGLPVTTIETRLARGRRMVRQAMDVRVIHRRADR